MGFHLIFKMPYIRFMALACILGLPFFSVPVHAQKFRKSPAVEAAPARLKAKVAALKEYAAKKGFSTRYALLADMQVPSNYNRLFLYSFSGDSVILSALVSHGIGSEKRDGSMVFGNEHSSHKSSVGRYAITGSYMGQFGLAFRLDGLDSSNSNARKRLLVIHAHDCVPESEGSPFLICQSLGCPVVSRNTLKLIAPYIQKSREPVLLWMYYD